jgi:squamous cell carcinoma antigen recognized by T-cells 3
MIFALQVDIAHDLTDLEKIRQSVELFAQAYPVSPEIWLRYLKVETAIAQSDVEIDRVQVLFQRALGDYYSIDIALEFACLASRCSDSKAKEIWEILLPAYGYEFTKGRLVWAAWRDDFMRREPDSPEKFKRIVKRFKEELLLPLSQMQLTYTEFRDFLEAHKDQFPNFDRSSIEEEVKESKKILQRALPFEQKLAKLEEKSHQERVEIFKHYIYDLADDLEEEYVQVLYERMITACCLNESVWKEYLSYIQNRSQDWSPVESNKSVIFRQTEMDIIKRGLRNCSWSADLYIEKMRILEANGESRQEIKDVLEEACAIQYNNAEPIVKVWIEYLSYLSRVTNFSDDKEKEILRKNFNFAWENLGRLYGNLADCDCEILKFWGRLEYTKFGDGNEGRRLWNTVMESNDNYTKSGLWLEFAELEMQHRGTEGARLIYKHALNTYELNDLPTIVSAWIRFERCNGSLDHVRHCQETCDKAMHQMRKKFHGAKRKVEVKKDGKRKAEDDHHPHQQKKAKETKEEFQKLSISKPAREENGEIDPSKDNVRVFFSNLDYSVTTEDLREGFPEITIVNFNVITTGKGKSRGFG